MKGSVSAELLRERVSSRRSHWWTDFSRAMRATIGGGDGRGGRRASMSYSSPSAFLADACVFLRDICCLSFLCYLFCFFLLAGFYQLIATMQEPFAEGYCRLNCFLSSAPSTPPTTTYSIRLCYLLYCNLGNFLYVQTLHSSFTYAAIWYVYKVMFRVRYQERKRAVLFFSLLFGALSVVGYCLEAFVLEQSFLVGPVCHVLCTLAVFHDRGENSQGKAGEGKGDQRKGEGGRVPSSSSYYYGLVLVINLLPSVTGVVGLQIVFPLIAKMNAPKPKLLLSYGLPLSFFFVSFINKRLVKILRRYYGEGRIDVNIPLFRSLLVLQMVQLTMNASYGRDVISTIGLSTCGSCLGYVIALLWNLLVVRGGLRVILKREWKKARRRSSAAVGTGTVSFNVDKTIAADDKQGAKEGERELTEDRKVKEAAEGEEDVNGSNRDTLFSTSPLFVSRSRQPPGLRSTPSPMRLKSTSIVPEEGKGTSRPSCSLSHPLNNVPSPHLVTSSFLTPLAVGKEQKLKEAQDEKRRTDAQQKKEVDEFRGEEPQSIEKKELSERTKQSMILWRHMAVTTAVAGISAVSSLVSVLLFRELTYRTILEETCFFHSSSSPQDPASSAASTARPESEDGPPPFNSSLSASTALLHLSSGSGPDWSQLSFKVEHFYYVATVVSLMSLFILVLEALQMRVLLTWRNERRTFLRCAFMIQLLYGPYLQSWLVLASLTVTHGLSC